MPAQAGHVGWVERSETHRRAQWWVTARSAPNPPYRAKAARRSLHPRQIIGEIDEILVLQRRHHRRHGGIVAAALVGLVFAQRPQKIVLALAGDARDLVLPGESRCVAEIAAVLRNDLLRVLDPRRIARVRRR